MTGSITLNADRLLQDETVLTGRQSRFVIVVNRHQISGRTGTVFRCHFPPFTALLRQSGHYGALAPAPASGSACNSRKRISVCDDCQDKLKPTVESASAICF